jgi:hypothetical protein
MGGLQSFVSRKEHRYKRKQFEYRHGSMASFLLTDKKRWSTLRKININQWNGRTSSRSLPPRQKKDRMPIPRGQAVNDPRLLALLVFIGSCLDDIATGTSIDAGKLPAIGSEERDEWEEGYLTALNDIVVFIQCLQSSAAA